MSDPSLPLDPPGRIDPAGELRGRIRPILWANRLLDKALGISPTGALNLGQPQAPKPHLAERMKRASLALLSLALDDNGLVDYARLAESAIYNEFRNLSLELPRFNLATLASEAEQLAFWINIYNVLVLDALVRWRTWKNARNVPLTLFRKAAYQIGAMRFTAEDIEHGILRGNKRNPLLPFPPFDAQDPRMNFVVTAQEARVHFALVCGARSCPPIAVYSPDRMDAQFDIAAANFLNNGGAEFDSQSGVLRLSKIFSWYEGDFGTLEDVLDLVGKHTRDRVLRSAIAAQTLRVRYQPYDWRINTPIEQANAAADRS